MTPTPRRSRALHLTEVADYTLDLLGTERLRERWHATPSVPDGSGNEVVGLLSGVAVRAEGGSHAATQVGSVTRRARDYNLNVDLPIVAGAMPEDRALTQELPQTATVSVSGEGWKLLSIYNNPPPVNVNVTNSEVNLYDQVQRQMSTTSEVNVQKVQPLMLTLNLEERISKTVPVQPVHKISFDNQYGFIETPTTQPDSVRISGAASLVEDIISWPTDSLSLTGVSTNVSETVGLRKNELISLSQDEVQFSGQVTQFTEGEVSVDLETRNLPDGRNIRYSPSSIIVKYDVPISEYADIENEELFEAYLTYQQIEEDSTGYVTPQIEQLSDNEHIKIRSSQPEQVAYFMVLDE